MNTSKHPTTRWLGRALLVAAAVTTWAGVALPTAAQAQTVVTTTVQYGPPPPPRAERAPAPRRGYVWAPGHWEWRGNHHVWMKGQWLRERRGYVYVAPAWQNVNGHWEYRAGRWDRDRDGVPNRYDHRPNDPRRR